MGTCAALSIEPAKSGPGLSGRGRLRRGFSLGVKRQELSNLQVICFATVWTWVLEESDQGDPGWGFFPAGSARPSPC